MKNQAIPPAIHRTWPLAAFDEALFQRRLLGIGVFCVSLQLNLGQEASKEPLTQIFFYNEAHLWKEATAL